MNENECLSFSNLRQLGAIRKEIWPQGPSHWPLKSHSSNNPHFVVFKILLNIRKFGNTFEEIKPIHNNCQIVITERSLSFMIMILLTGCPLVLGSSLRQISYYPDQAFKLYSERYVTFL